MSEEEPFIVLFHASENDYLQQVKFRLQKDPSLRISETSSGESISSDIQRFRCGVLLFYIRTSDDLDLVLKALTELYDLIKTGALRVIGASEIEEAGTLGILREKGADIFPVALEWSSLQRKIEQAFENLSADPEETKPEDTGFFPYDPALSRNLKIWLGSDEPNDAQLTEAAVLEFSDGTLILDVAAHLFSAGQKILLITDDGSGSATSKHKLLTTISDVNPCQEERDEVSVPLRGELEAHLKPTREAYRKMQVQIDHFMKAARGW